MRLLMCDFPRHVSLSDDMRDYQVFSDVTLVCEEKQQFETHIATIQILYRSHKKHTFIH